MSLLASPRGSKASKSLFSNGNFTMKKLTNPKNKTTFILKLFEFNGKKWSYFCNFHTLSWSNQHLKFHFRGYFTKSSFWHLKSEVRAKIFTVLIAWLGSVNFAILCHSGTSKGFGAIRVSWSEADHHRSRRLFDI